MACHWLACIHVIDVRVGLRGYFSWRWHQFGQPVVTHMNLIHTKTIITLVHHHHQVVLMEMGLHHRIIHHQILVVFTMEVHLQRLQLIMQQPGVTIHHIIKQREVILT